MDAPIEPQTFDIIVVGTGLPESILAGAAAVAGKNIVHLDAAEFYGSHWASLSLETLDQWAASGGQLAPPSVPAAGSEHGGPPLVNGTVNGTNGPGNGTLNGTVNGALNGTVNGANGAENGGADCTVNGAAEPELTANGVTPRQENLDGVTYEDQSEAATSSPEVVPSHLDLCPIASPPHDGSFYSNVMAHAFSEPLESSRAYAVDLAGPRLAFCAGPMVDLLIRSGCHSYLEFKAMEGSYLWQNGDLAAVPASRADIFQASMTLSEKRVVSRFFKKVTDYIAARAESGEEEGAPRNLPPGDLGLEDPQAPFVELLRRQQLPARMREFVLYNIAMIAEDQEEAEPALRVTTQAGLQRMTRYLTSIGRFGGAGTPFLYPLYGAGELPQAFCRLAAVKGALYVLRRGLDGILIDKASGECKGVRTSTGQLLYAQKLVLGPGYWPAALRATAAEQAPESSPPPGSSAVPAEGARDPAESVGTTGLRRLRQVARCLCIVEGSLREGKSTVLLVFPPKSLEGPNACAVRCLQVGFTCSVAPRNRFIVQFSTPRPDGRPAEEVLRPAVEALFTPAEPPSQQQESDVSESQSEAATSALAGGVPGEPQPTAIDNAAEGPTASSATVGAEPAEDVLSRPDRGASDDVTAVHQEGTSARANDGDAGGHSQQLPPGNSSGRVQTEGASVGGPSGSGNGDGQVAAGKPRLLWCVYYNQARPAPGRFEGTTGGLPAGIITCGMPDETVDYDSVVRVAEEAFRELVPGEPFFPQTSSPGSDDDEEDGENGHLAEDEEAQLLGEAYAANGDAPNTADSPSVDPGATVVETQVVEGHEPSSESESGTTVSSSDNSDVQGGASLSDGGAPPSSGPLGP